VGVANQLSRELGDAASSLPQLCLTADDEVAEAQHFLAAFLQLIAESRSICFGEAICGSGRRRLGHGGGSYWQARPRPITRDGKAGIRPTARPACYCVGFACNILAAAMKLIIQIPCLNEEDQLPATLADLPRAVSGFDEVEWLIIDDGSIDATVDVARAQGVDHIVKLTNNKGLASAFQAGLDAALKLGADVVVNTDADNQYSAKDIPTLVAPIVAGEADMVIGDRNVMAIEHFSASKKRLQRLGSWVVRQASDTDVPDATSGFRAYNREAALGLTVVSKFTYTLESLIQAGKSLVAVEHVTVGTNDQMRESRLFTSMWSYIRRNIVTIFRIYTAYEPLRVFSALAVVLLVAAVGAWSPFLWDWLVHSDRSGHLQSIILGGVLLIAAFQVFALGVLAELIVSHRVVTQRTLERVRRIELELGVPPSHYLAGDRGAGATLAPDGRDLVDERPDADDGDRSPAAAPPHRGR
jgi:glycosyltransferase involved in cell wall biosynthesis